MYRLKPRFRAIRLVFACGILLYIPFLSGSLHAQIDGLTVEAYGEINYRNYWWDTDLGRRARMDLERFALEGEYLLGKNISVEVEIEFEHGGTGASLEFDKFEEFGEYEQEVEKGGEIVLEKMLLEMKIASEFNIRLGHLYVPVGLLTVQYEPTEHYTIGRSEAESNMIPSIWHETGVEAFGTIGGVAYQALVVNGLDATGFSSATWIQRGHQTRFEYANAENLAFVARLDYSFGEESESLIGVSGYFGNSADNRPKPDLTVPANVAIGDFHVLIEDESFRASGLVMYGTLQNADKVSQANRNISNNLNVKRTPVGSAALGWFVEAGYNILPLLSYTPDASDTIAFSHRLDVFGRYEFYDTMYEVAEGVFDNPRWERTTWTAGVNYSFYKGVVLKGEFAHRTLGLATDNIEDTFALGVGFQI